MSHIEPTLNNHCPIYVILPFIHQDSICQVEKNIWINIFDNQLLIIQATIEANKQYSDEKMMKLIADLTGMITSMMAQILFF